MITRWRFFTEEIHFVFTHYPIYQRVSSRGPGRDFISFVLPLALGLMISAAPSAAMGPRVTNGGYMQSKAARGQEQVLSLEHTAVEAEISGVVAAVQVTQHFRNPTTRPMEAIYVFPLPHRAAVYGMTMVVGSRTIQGVVHRRAEARRLYERAKAQGQSTALLEEERPNVFTQSVANILPGAQIKVILQYVEELLPEEGRYEFVFPMVVGPRYVGGGRIYPDSTGTGWAKDTTRISDASRITPPFLAPGERSGQDMDLRVRLHGGAPLQTVRALTHQVIVQRSKREAQITLADRSTIPNKDFVLQYSLAGARPQSGVLAQRDARGGHFLLTLHSPARLAEKDIAPREYVFVLDISGSMDGFPVEQGKQLIASFLARARATDTFQIVLFESGVATFAPQAVPVTPQRVAAAQRWLQSVSGRGGTEFIPALRTALETPLDPARARMVLFMTDGYIGYEREVLRYLATHRQGNNLFALGIGSSVNRYLIDGMAQLGGGRPYYVLKAADAPSVTERLRSTLSRPALTNIRVDWGGLDARAVVPETIPDLFPDQPVLLSGTYTKGGTYPITLRGLQAGRPFVQKLHITFSPGAHQENQGVAYLWARRRIAAWTERQAVEPAFERDGEEHITNLALSYNLMSKYTSLLAVDQTDQQHSQLPHTINVSLPLPAGVSTLAAPLAAYTSGSRIKKDELDCLIDSAIGSRTPPARSGPPSTVPRPTLSRQAILQVMRRQELKKKLRSCYQQATSAAGNPRSSNRQKPPPALKGMLQLTLIIQPDGTITLKWIHGEHALREARKACVQQVLRGVHFPPNKERAPFTITYPLVFQPRLNR